MFHDNLYFIGAAQAELGCPYVKDLVEEIPLVPIYSISCPFLWSWKMCENKMVSMVYVLRHIYMN